MVYKVISDAISPGGYYYKTVQDAIEDIARRALEKTVIKIEKSLEKNEHFVKVMEQNRTNALRQNTELSRLDIYNIFSKEMARYIREELTVDIKEIEIKMKKKKAE
jgi:methyl coenzyme M reductase beta subunit